MVCHITIHSDNVMALKKLVVLIKYQINNQKMTIWNKPIITILIK